MRLSRLFQSHQFFPLTMIPKTPLRALARLNSLACEDTKCPKQFPVDGVWEQVLILTGNGNLSDQEHDLAHVWLFFRLQYCWTSLCTDPYDNLRNQP